MQRDRVRSVFLGTHSAGCWVKRQQRVALSQASRTSAESACLSMTRLSKRWLSSLPAGFKVPDQYVQLDLDKSASGTGSRIRDERPHHYKLRVKPAIGTLDLTMTYLGDPTKAPIQVGVVVRLSHADLGEVQGVVESIEQEQPAP